MLDVFSFFIWASSRRLSQSLVHLADCAETRRRVKARKGRDPGWHFAAPHTLHNYSAFNRGGWPPVRGS
jgi:hypothetical protein